MVKLFRASKPVYRDRSRNIAQIGELDDAGSIVHEKMLKGQAKSHGVS